MELGKFGVWTSYRAIGEENAGEAARLVEDLGFGTFWLGGSPKVPQTRPLLEPGSRLAVATGILNVWANDPASVAAEYHEMAAEFPDRLLLGIGIGHPEAIEPERPRFACERGPQIGAGEFDRLVQKSRST